MNRRLLLAWVCALGAAAGSLRAHHAREQPTNRRLKGWQVSPFSLTDFHGQPFTDRELLGRWSFMLLGDTRCGEPCNGALAALAGLCRRIERTDALKVLQVVFVSTDASHDTPERLREHLAPYGPRFVGTSGEPGMLHHLADDLGLAGDEPPGGWPDAQHRYRGSLVLVGPDAVVRAEYLPPFDVLLLTSDFMRVKSRR
jgi:protein SCO1/2